MPRVHLAHPSSAGTAPLPTPTLSACCKLCSEPASPAGANPNASRAKSCSLPALTTEAYICLLHALWTPHLPRNPSLLPYLHHLCLHIPNLCPAVLWTSLYYTHVFRLSQSSHSAPLPCPGSEFRIMSVSLMLAGKALYDRPCSNVAWSQVTGIALTETNTMEWEMIHCLSYSVIVPQSRLLPFVQSVMREARRMRASATAAATQTADRRPQESQRLAKQQKVQPTSAQAKRRSSEFAPDHVEKRLAADHLEVPPPQQQPLRVRVRPVSSQLPQPTAPNLPTPSPSPKSPFLKPGSGTMATVTASLPRRTRSTRKVASAVVGIGEAHLRALNGTDTSRSEALKL